MKFIRPALGLLQGLIVYYLFTRAQLTDATLVSALIILTFPLFALQVKLPSKDTVVMGISFLIVMALVYGYAGYHLLFSEKGVANPLAPVLATQCVVSAFIIFVFYCVAMQEKRLVFPYITLFSEAWQIVLKLFLGQILVTLTWGLFWLAALLFDLIGIPFVRTFVDSKEFLFIMPPLFFGIAMTILHHYEDILTKFRNILLAFCQFLYPIFVIISLCFLFAIPFSHRAFSGFWQIIAIVSIINIILFNGIFQAGFDKPPYSAWFCKLIYLSIIMTFGYSLYVLRFPLTSMYEHGFEADAFLSMTLLVFLTLYNFCYSLAIFFSKKPWLSMVKICNTLLALLIAILYLVLALPWIDLGKYAMHHQIAIAWSWVYS